MARSLVDRGGFLQPPIDPYRLARLRGIHKVILSASLETSGALILNEEQELIVQLKASEPLERRNFSLCHEIAHTLVTNVKDAKFRPLAGPPTCTKWSVEEYLCDQAAGEMLMPAKLFKAAALAHEPSLNAVAALAQIFSASISATIVRIGQLALWPVVFIVWRFKTHFDSPPKLRVSWSVRPHGTRCFVPRHASAAPHSSMLATYESGISTIETDFLSFGSLAGRFLVENSRFGNHVVSLVHAPKMGRETQDGE